jgi:hypothetical protein
MVNEAVTFLITRWSPVLSGEDFDELCNCKGRNCKSDGTPGVLRASRAAAARSKIARPRRYGLKRTAGRSSVQLITATLSKSAHNSPGEYATDIIEANTSRRR